MVRIVPVNVVIEVFGEDRGHVFAESTDGET